MSEMRMRSWRDLSIQTKMLVIILPLVVAPMLILAAVGFTTGSREAAKTSTRYLAQRETDLRTLAENPAIVSYFNNRAYGLTEEAEVSRRELERSFKRFVDRSNSVDPIYAGVSYVDPQGDEVAKVVEGRIQGDRHRVSSHFVATVKGLGSGEAYVSPIGPRMTYAVAVHQPGSAGQEPRFMGAVAVDFAYPVHDFQRTTEVIARTFMIITAISLGLALILTIGWVRRLTNPIRRLAEAARHIAAGRRDVGVAIDSGDEIGRLAQSFNEMAASLEQNEAALRRKVGETTTLYEIGQEITSQVALEPTLRLIVERARDLSQAEVGLLLLRDETDGAFVVQAYSGRAGEALTRNRVRPGEGITGRVVDTGRPLLVEDYARDFQDSPFLLSVQEAGLRSALAVPLRTRGAVFGVLLVTSRSVSKFRQEDEQLLSALADQAAIAIENATLYEQARRHAVELEAKVEQRTRELQRANLELEAASRHKSEFLANMSHELRTPLNAIIGFSRLVMRRSKEALPAKQYENLEKILVSADHLLKLINDILDLSKIEAGRMEVRPSAFELAPLVDECLRTVEPLVRSAQLRLVTDLQGELPRLFTDRDKLKQILINLLSNAVKFTEAGTITVTARPQAAAIDVAVADTGIGIPADALELIFEEFRQVDSTTTRKYGGTGLGLSISRHFARLLGGDIGVESVMGAGSTFTLTLPLDVEIRPATAAPAALDELPVAAENGRVVLAIDDDPDVIYLLRENLAEAGYRVVGALSGEEGLRKARELKPFAVTLDITMPHKDGWEVLHALKADPATKDIPIIVVSIVDNRDLGFRLGAFDYLLKPLDRGAIVSTLGRIAPARGRILVVDDDPDVADMVGQLLEDEPYEVVAAADGQEALEAIARQRPDVILLDLLMPRMDGFAVIQHLREDARWQSIPVIVLTAKTLTAAEHGALQQSVLKVVQKMGLEREAFIRELRAALHAYRART